MTKTALVLLAALGLAACNKPATETAAADNAAMDNSGMAAMPGAIGTEGMMAGAAAASTPDFVMKAAMSDMFEVESAKVALARSQTAEIRKFAQTMIDDHTATTSKVKAIVTKDNLAPPPAALDEEHAKMLADLKATDAAGFDTAYLDGQTKAHEDALDLLQNYAASGDNADLKAFAQDTAPKVKSHLDMAKGLDKGGVDDKAAAKPAA